MLKLNLMCCDLPLPREEGWINCDISTSPHIKADLRIDCTKLRDHFGENSVDQIYCGHGLEHLYPTEAEEAMEDWKAVLKPGGILGIVTPDFRYIAQGYLNGDPEFRHDELIQTFIFSYKQESVHRTLWDVDSMKKLFLLHGFKDITEIDRMNDPRVAFGVEWQCGCEGRK